jgi:hypothetical protein
MHMFTEDYSVDSNLHHILLQNVRNFHITVFPVIKIHYWLIVHVEPSKGTRNTHITPTYCAIKQYIMTYTQDIAYILTHCNSPKVHNTSNATQPWAIHIMRG